MALWILWTLPAVVLILIWFAILSFFDPENLPRAVDDDPKLAAYTAQLAGTDKRKEDKHGSTNGARDSSWSNRSEDRVIRAGSSADPGTATRQSHGRAVSGSPGTKDADPKVSETTGGSAQENESQGNAIAQYALAGSDSARSPSNGNDSTPMDPAQDHWDSDPYGDDPLDRSLSISGQTVSEDGNPVSGIEVVATARRLFDEEQAQLDYFGGPVEKRTASDVAGYFQFSGLPNGEYQISTVATDYYPIVVSTVSRAGVDALKLVVVEQREIWINGFVTTPEGEPLDEVEISAYSSPEPVDVSGLSGDFAFTLAVRSDRGELISFRADGYQAKKVPIAPRDWHNGQPVELEVVMQPEKVLTVVSGALLSKAGDPIAGEQVYLKQSLLRCSTFPCAPATMTN